MHVSGDCEAFLVLTRYLVGTVSALIDKCFESGIFCIFACMFVCLSLTFQSKSVGIFLNVKL